jgi:hypothetical protein
LKRAGSAVLVSFMPTAPAAPLTCVPFAATIVPSGEWYSLKTPATSEPGHAASRPLSHTARAAIAGALACPACSKASLSQIPAAWTGALMAMHAIAVKS